MTNLLNGKLKTLGRQGWTKGYFVASDAWMDEYTYQIVVRKDFLTAEELAAYEAEPQVLAPWDPMGALASKIRQYMKTLEIFQCFYSFFKIYR